MFSKIKFVLMRTLCFLFFFLMPAGFSLWGTVLDKCYPGNSFLHYGSMNFFVGWESKWYLPALGIGLILCLWGCFSKSPLIHNRILYAGVLIWSISLFLMWSEFISILSASLPVLIFISLILFFSKREETPLKHDRWFRLVQSGYILFLMPFLFIPGFNFLMLTPWKYLFLIPCAGILIHDAEKRKEFYLLSFIALGLCGILQYMLTLFSGDTVLVMNSSITCCQMYLALIFFLLLRTIYPWKYNFSVFVLAGGFLIIKIIPTASDASWSIPMGVFLFYIFLDNLSILRNKLQSSSGNAGKIFQWTVFGWSAILFCIILANGFRILPAAMILQIWLDRKKAKEIPSMRLAHTIYLFCTVLLLFILSMENQSGEVLSGTAFLLAGGWLLLSGRWRTKRSLWGIACLLAGIILFLPVSIFLH